VPFALPPADRVLRQHEVVSRVGLSIETIYRRIKVGEFPKPVRLGPASVGWRESAVNAWIANLPEVDLAPPEELEETGKDGGKGR
jgi:prophage regulatory protein